MTSLTSTTKGLTPFEAKKQRSAELIELTKGEDASGLLVYAANLSMQDAIKGTSMQSVSIWHGKPTVQKALNRIIGVGVQAFGAAFNSSQLALTSIELMNDNPTESLEDVAMFLKKLKKGEYGSMYGDLDPPKFFLHWRTYLEEKAQLRERGLIDEEHMLDRLTMETAKHLRDKGMKVAVVKKVPKMERPVATQEEHVARFLELLPTFDAENLEKARQEYSRPSVKQHFPEYIEAIENEMEKRK